MNFVIKMVIEGCERKTYSPWGERQQGLWARICCDADSRPRICQFPVFQSLHRKWAQRKGRSDVQGFNDPIEGLPELIDACNGKESVFAAIVGQEFQSSQIAQVCYHRKNTVGMSECWFTTDWFITENQMIASSVHFTEMIFGRGLFIVWRSLNSTHTHSHTPLSVMCHEQSCHCEPRYLQDLQLQLHW